MQIFLSSTMSQPKSSPQPPNLYTMPDPIDSNPPVVTHSPQLSERDEILREGMDPATLRLFALWVEGLQGELLEKGFNTPEIKAAMGYQLAKLRRIAKLPISAGDKGEQTSD